MVNSKEYVTRVISSVVLFLAIYNLVDSKAPLTVTFKENENCFNLTAECEFDGDCCDPPGAEFGAECPRRSGVCSICSGTAIRFAKYILRCLLQVSSQSASLMSIAAVCCLAKWTFAVLLRDTIAKKTLIAVR